MTTAQESNNSKPDILSITKSFVPRSQSWLYDEIAHLKRHHVHVLTQERFFADEFPHQPVDMLPSARTWASRIKRALIRLSGQLPPVLTGQAGKKISKFIANGDYGLIQAHFGWIGIDIAATIKKSGLPFVVWIYGADVFHNKQARRFTKHITPEINYCCTSQALKDQLLKLGCNNKQVHVLYPGVRIANQFPERTESDKLRIVSVGRLVPFKDPLSLLEVARFLREKGHGLHWQHLGRGPLHKQMEQGIRKYGLEDSFILRGAVPHKDVLKTMQASDLMVHPAMIQPDGRRESFGVVLAEAAAAGLPIVSSPVGGIPEIVIEGQTGFLVADNSTEKIAAKALLLASEPELRRQLGQTAFQHAKTTFNLEKQIEALDTFYDGIIA